MRQRVTMTTALALVLVFSGGCGDDDDNENPELPNPAAVFCEEQGGKTSGPEPMCELPDGSIVDAWEYYRTEGPGE
jgi:putative hemolysin